MHDTVMVVLQIEAADNREATNQPAPAAVDAATGA